MHTYGCHRLCDNRVYQVWCTKFSLFHWLYTQKQKQMTEKSSALHKNQRRGRDWLRCILHRLTPIPSARRRGPSKACEAISYCVAPFCFPYLCLQASLSHRYKKTKRCLSTSSCFVVFAEREVTIYIFVPLCILGGCARHEI